MNGTTETTAAPDVTTASRFGPMARELRASIELFALCGIAFAQPIFDALRIRTADSVLPLHPSAGSMLLITAAILLAAPVALWALEVVVGLLIPAARERVHRILLAGLVGLIAFIVLGNQTGLSVGALAAIGAVLAVLAVRLFRRFEAARLFLRFLAFAPLVFAAIFLTGSQIRPIVTGAEPGAAVDTRIGDPKRIVQIVTDEFPTTSLMDGTGRIDRGLFPNIAALADDSTWYRNTTSVAPYTQAAIPALLTGRYPEQPNDLPTAANFPESQFSLLGGTYRVHAREITAESLCGVESCTEPTSNPVRALAGVARDLWWEFASPGDAVKPKCLCDANTLKDGLPHVRRFLAELAPSKGPTFDYLHVLLPHAPWHLQPNGQSYSDEFSIPEGLSFDTLEWTSEGAALAGRKRHLLQLQTLDRYVGQVTEKLRRIGEYDDSVIVLTADHGVSFTDGQMYRLPTDRNYHEIMWVPLLVKQAGNAAAGTIDDRPARTIDIMPTIADLVDADVPWRVDGRSLLGPPRTAPDTRFLEWPSGFAFLAPKEARYRRFDEQRGFAAVLATPAVSPTLPDEYRLYGYGAAGRFGSVVGRRAAELAVSDPPARNVIVSNDRDYRNVNVYAPKAPWTVAKGGLDGTEQVPLAIAVNGLIAGITQTRMTEVGSPSFSAILDPAAFIDGANDIQIYVIRGTPEAPRLELVRPV